MRKYLFLFILLALPGALFSYQTETYTYKGKKSLLTSSSVSGDSVEVISGRVLVKFKNGVSETEGAGLLADKGFYPAGKVGNTGFYIFKDNNSDTVSSAVASLEALTDIDEVIPDKSIRPSKIPDDPYVSSQYALSVIGAYAAWEYGTGEETSGNRVTVAVIDTGIDGTHEDLKNKLIGTHKSFLDGNVSDDDLTLSTTVACFHATGVASSAAAETDNAKGIAGVSWGAGLLSLRVFKASDCGGKESACKASCNSANSDIAKAIEYAGSLAGTSEYGHMIINLSLGSDGFCDSVTQSAVNYAAGRGALIFAAAGNSASDVEAPANCDNVIPVAATDSGDSVASFSCHGEELMERGFSAPGVGIYMATSSSARYTTASGTSFSCPITAGAAALIWAEAPEVSSSTVIQYLADSADDLGESGPDEYYGLGRIDIKKAMQAVKGVSGGTVIDKVYSYPSPFYVSKDKFATVNIPSGIKGTGTEIKIFSPEGELVRKLDGTIWDGKNTAGLPAASGVYIIRVKTDKGSGQGKMILIK